MIALDTSIVVRVIAADDAAQFKRASILLATQECLLLLAVALETEWVLRSLYGLAPERIATSLEIFAAIPSVFVEKAVALQQALAALRTGFDFGDADHLYSAETEGIESLATFDKKFAKRALCLQSAVHVVEV